VPVTFTGRQRGGGMRPFRDARVIKPSSAIARSTASGLSGSVRGLITIGSPRFVKTTPCPVRTALMPVENCRFAPRRPKACSDDPTSPT